MRIHGRHSSECSGRTTKFGLQERLSSISTTPMASLQTSWKPSQLSIGSLWISRDTIDLRRLRGYGIRTFCSGMSTFGHLCLSSLFSAGSYSQKWLGSEAFFGGVFLFFFSLSPSSFISSLCLSRNEARRAKKLVLGKSRMREFLGKIPRR